MRYPYIIALLFLALFVFIHDAQSQSLTEDYEKLTGNWVRPDGGYTLVIKNISFDGSIEAYYLNPNPINVSEARFTTKLGKINIFVELRDAGYPGSYYTLVYDPDSNHLAGVYHHLGLNQNFDVYFVRK
jgi:uncharacterized protein (DUF2147 family)